ncbi:hypothetical protein Drose_17005 [Dactylosporangium roseum]|uniref:Uncharacterized protein n=1 Tax=Dactylosporangium roseum TaxID=47989 RepID=A0ABY5ZDV4_9ACTN|nr:hypothetical protein [Dactylosporangium roseum]UWZ39766.1 hypothetical protein Drose_17005 [Dactylosporangium roseum]
MDPLAAFFEQRVFGASRKVLLGAAVDHDSVDTDLARQKAALVAEIRDIQERQARLIQELENLKPSGDPEVDEAWRSGIQTRFAATVAEQCTKKELLGELVRKEKAAAPVDLDLLDVLPQGRVDLNRLPEEQQRRIYDAFHLELRYNAHRREVTIRVSITGETAPILAATIETILDERAQTQKTGSEANASDPGEVVADALRAPGRTRTCDSTAVGSAIEEVAYLDPPGRRQVSRPSSGVNVEWPVLDAAAVRLGFDIRDAERVADLAAVAVTRLAWRDGPVEDWHSVRLRRITDPEMMRANTATTRVVRESIGQLPLFVRQLPSMDADLFTRMGDVLCDRARRLPDGRRLPDLAPDRGQLALYEQHVAAYCAQWRLVASDVGPQKLFTLLACHAAIFNWRWWLSTGWNQLVAEFIRRIDDPNRWDDPWEVANLRRLGPLPDGLTTEQLHTVLLAGPDYLSPAVAGFCLRAGLGALHPDACGLPPVQRHLLPAHYLRMLEPRWPI